MLPRKSHHHRGPLDAPALMPMKLMIDQEKCVSVASVRAETTWKGAEILDERDQDGIAVPARPGIHPPAGKSPVVMRPRPGPR